MGPRKGRPHKGELVDMTVYPDEARCQEPSFRHPVETFEAEIFLAAGHKAGVVDHYRAGTTQMVAFAVWQSIAADGEGWDPVFRIDSWHGTVHRHDYTKSGSNHITILADIPIDHPEKVIAVWRGHAESVIMTEWEENVRRWRGDTE